MLKTNNSVAGSLLPIAYETILKQLSPNQFVILDHTATSRELKLNYPWLEFEWTREEIDHLEGLKLIKEVVEIEIVDVGRSPYQTWVGKNKYENVYVLTELGRQIQAMKA